MSTSKNTAKYLAFVFIFAFCHYKIPRMDIILGFVFFSACILFAAKCTGMSRLIKSPANVVITIVLSFLLAWALPWLEKLCLGIFYEEAFRIQPLANIPGLLMCVLLSLILCKLTSFKMWLKFPRSAYLALCFAPVFIYFILGALLSLIDVEALEWALAPLPGIYSGSIILGYNFFIYPAFKDITMGWSIFCMMKYNQSMKIKALLEMQSAA